MRVVSVFIACGFLVATYVAAPGDRGGRRPDPQPPPGDHVAQGGREAPPPAQAGIAVGVMNRSDRPIAFLVDPEFHTIALFTYLRSRTPILAPGDFQRLVVPPGPYQVLVDGCPRGDLLQTAPGMELRLDFLAGPEGSPPVATLAASGTLMFQTVLRPEPPPPEVYVCPVHPDVRFLTPCACPVCHVEVIVVRPAVVFVCPAHPMVRLEAGGVCTHCSTPLVFQMNFWFEAGGHEEQALVDPLGPEGGTRAEAVGEVEHHAKPAPPDPLAPPPEDPKTPPAEPQPAPEGQKAPEQPQPPPEEPKQPPDQPPPPEQPPAPPEQPPVPPDQPPPPPEQPPPPPEEPKKPPKKPPEEEPKEPPEEQPKQPPEQPPEEQPKQPPEEPERPPKKKPKHPHDDEHEHRTSPERVIDLR